MSKTNCCSSSISPDHRPEWIIGEWETGSTRIPVVKPSLTLADRIGGWQVRWGMNRTNYRIKPGLYAVGNPLPSSPVLVSANYKLSFDMLRKELQGQNLWILVIDTKGVNVWCAAGKGTFGTKEIIKRIYQTRLPQIVTSRTLIIPQLGAPGVAAYTVTKVTKFKVIFGPVRASDLPAFLEANMVATREMRQVHFDLKDRLILTAVEVKLSLKYAFMILAILFAINLVQPDSWHLGAIVYKTLLNSLPYLGAVLIGTVAVPLMLPWLPGRAFALKGWIPGMVWAIFVSAVSQFFGWDTLNWFLLLTNLLLLPAISAFFALNFTGSSTYTSLSGVKKEMRIALPLLAGSAGLGIILLLTHKILEFF